MVRGWGTEAGGEALILAMPTPPCLLTLRSTGMACSFGLSGLVLNSLAFCNLVYTQQCFTISASIAHVTDRTGTFSVRVHLELFLSTYCSYFTFSPQTGWLAVLLLIWRIFLKLLDAKFLLTLVATHSLSVCGLPTHSDQSPGGIFKFNLTTF